VRQPETLDERYGAGAGRIYLSGLQALVRLPMDARRRDERAGRNTAVFISGYEGSPLAGYDLELARRKALLDSHQVTFSPALNEELAATAVLGSQLSSNLAAARYDGVTGIWYGKAPGLDRATDALRHGNLAGAHPEGGVLVVVGDDGLAKSSTVPSGSELALAELSLPTLSPCDSQDVLELGLHGIAMSRFCGLWVGLKIATQVADSSVTVQLRPDAAEPVIPDGVVDGVDYRHRVTAEFLQPTIGELERSVPVRLELARRYARANGLNRILGAADARLGIVAAGSSYLDVCQALSDLGLDGSQMDGAGIRVLKLGLVYPLDGEIIREFAAGLDEIIVVEEKRAFIETMVKETLYSAEHRPLVSGKFGQDGRVLFRQDADVTPDAIAAAIAQRLVSGPGAGPAGLASGLRSWLERRAARAAARPVSLPLIARRPVFCSGCPHNRSTEASPGSLVGAGIGCSAIAVLMPAQRVGEVVGLTQMGGEGASWLGIAPFVSTDHFVQNMGDGTFHHSGSLAVRAAIAAGTNMTFKILYNSAVAMTGGQAVVGGLSVAALARMLIAEGVSKVVITTDEPARYRSVTLPRGVEVRDRDDLAEVQGQLARIRGVTVLINDQECATELRRKRKRGLAETPRERAFINQRVCEGCGDCGVKSQCVSLQPVGTEYGRKTQVHQGSCNQDFSCLDGDCPSFLTIVPPPAKRRAGTARQRPAEAAERAADGSRLAPLKAGALPDPDSAPAAGEVTVRITGIGGTGVVTLAQILAAAAARAGLAVRALDQTGLAQKGGAVVSDLRFSARLAPRSARLTAGSCDVYLGCDALVAASEVYLGVADPLRTVAVVSTSEVPTGDMVTDVTVGFPAGDDLSRRISSVTRAGRSEFVDARALAHRLFRDDQSANILLAGVACQLGVFPFSAADIEAAIELNGIAVAANLQAFRRGRQYVADRRGLEAALDGLTAGPAGERPAATPPPRYRGIEPESQLADLVTRRADDLLRYQDARYAAGYVEVIERVRSAEESVAGSRTELSLAVAQNLHKVMAYKDEYEVARLSLDPALEREIEAQFGSGARVSYRLHPPVLRALGLRRKVALGPWFRTVFAVLYRLRRLRGSRLDPFGYTRLRRAERLLITEYRQLIDECIARLSPASYDVTAQLLALPDMIRGYEQVKLDSVARYHAEVESMCRERDELSRETAPVPAPH
jgi:indolepyruvate ferredoxin oxidoreductase